MYVLQQMPNPEREQISKNNIKLRRWWWSLCSRGPKNIGPSISSQVADAYPLIELAGEVTESCDTSMHAVCIYVLMSGESELCAWKW